MISTKPKKVLTPEQLEKLKVAREKALSVRQGNAKDKALEKELAQAEKTQRITEVKAKLNKLAKPEVPKVVQVESEPEDEPVAEPVVKVKKVKKKPKVIIVEDSDTDDEQQQQVIYVKKKKKEVPATPVVPVAVSEPVKEVASAEEQNDDPYQQHYNSIFGGRRRHSRNRLKQKI